MSVDAVFGHLCAATLALVLLVGAWQKLRDLLVFELSVDAYELLPTALVTPFARLLPVLEISAGVLLLLPPWRAIGAALALTVLVLVTSAVVVNLLRGRTDVGCGCGGIEDEQPLSWLLVARNAVLALAAVATFAIEPRPLVPLDLLTITAGAASLYGLFVMTNQLIANQPRLMQLRVRA